MVTESRPANRVRSPQRGQLVWLFCALFSLAGVSRAPAAETPAPRVLLLDATMVGSDIVAVGEIGTVLRSSDSGRSWNSHPAVTKATLTGVSFAPGSPRGWAVGHDALILATEDGGQTWTKAWQGENLEASFLDVCAVSADHVIAVGAYGLYVATSDGGKTWTSRQILDEDMHLNRISRGPTGTLYIAGERGTLLRSSDQGESWTPIDSPYDGSFYGILPLGPETLLAYGLRGRVFRSTDNGGSWTPIALPQPMLIATAIATRSGAVVLAGQPRALFGSRDQGASFAPVETSFTSAVAELLEAPDGTVLALGEAGATRLPEAAATLPGHVPGDSSR